MALIKTGRFLSKAEVLGVGVFSPLSKNGQETKHVKIGHVKIDRAHFRVHFRVHWTISREHWEISREHSRGSLRGDPLVHFTQKKNSTFVGISVDIFVYTPVCIFVSAFVREFVGQISRFACLCFF